MANQQDRFTDLLNRINEISDDDLIPWYKKATRVCKGFSAKTHNKPAVKSKVYIILLKIVGKKKIRLRFVCRENKSYTGRPVSTA